MENTTENQEEFTTNDLVKFLKAMQTSNENLTRQINTNHELLSKEIKESISKIQKELLNINKSIEDVKTNNAKTDEKK